MKPRPRPSNPTCRRWTSRPNPTNKEAGINVGVAAHIRAASPRGPRSDPTATFETLTSAENGIWLCHTCSRTVDDAPDAFSVDTLGSWKAHAERTAAREGHARADEVADLVLTIEGANETLIRFGELWQANEPAHDFEDFAASADRLIRYSQARLSAYQREVAPLVTEITVRAETYLGADPAVTELKSDAMHASVNYIGMRMLADRLQRLKAILELH